MRLFFGFLLPDEFLKSNSNPNTLAAKEAVNNSVKKSTTLVKSVWRHHFGLRLIDGQEEVASKVDASKIMIVNDTAIAQKIVNLYSEWKYLEQLSRRPDRATTSASLERNAKFKEMLDMPFSQRAIFIGHIFTCKFLHVNSP